MVDDLRRFLVKLERASITPLALVGASTVKLSAFRSGGRPARLQMLGITCRGDDVTTAVISVEEGRSEVPREVLLD